MLISIGAATTVLCTPVILLTFVKVLLKLKYQYNYNLKAFLLQNEETENNNSNSVPVLLPRWQKFQENTINSIFISVLLFAINSKSPCLEQTLPLLIFARCMYTASFLFKKQPHRFVSSTIIFFCNCYLIYYNLVYGNDLQASLSCLLLKVQLNLPIIAFLRYLTKTPDQDIVEDSKFFKLEKPPAERDSLVERAVELQKNDVYSVLIFVAVAKLTQEAGIGGHSRDIQILLLTRFFTYVRIFHTGFFLFGLPKLLTCIFYLSGVAIQVIMLIPWKYHYGFGYPGFEYKKKSHLVMTVFLNIWIVHFIQQLSHIASGRFAGPGLNWLMKPEKYKETTENHLENQLKSHLNNAIPACLSIFLYKFVKVPYTLIYYMVLCRFLYSLSSPKSFKIPRLVPKIFAALSTLIALRILLLYWFPLSESDLGGSDRKRRFPHLYNN